MLILKTNKGVFFMKLGATLYVKNSVNAVEFYKEVFGMSLGYNVKNNDGTFMHAELEKDDNEVFSVSESNNQMILDIMLNTKLNYDSRPIMTYGIDFKNEDEIKKAYELLIIGGNVLFPLGPLPWSTLAAEVVDKFGVCWFISFNKE
jgi:uncharacterized glyoxalase superfamily protein PhnB